MIQIEENEIKDVWFIAQHFSRHTHDWVTLQDTWTSAKEKHAEVGLVHTGEEPYPENPVDECIQKLKSKKRQSDRFRIVKAYQVYKPVKEINTTELNRR